MFGNASGVLGKVRGVMKASKIARIRPARVAAAALLPLMAIALSGCGTGAAKNDTFDLAGARVADGGSKRNVQILVPEPTALQSINSEQIIVRVAGSEIQNLGQSQWADRLPSMVQAKLLEGFENSGKLGGVGKPGQGLAIDYQVVSEIRAFEIDTVGTNRALVEISVKILNDRNGTVRAHRVFRATAPVSGGANYAYVRGLNDAFSKVASEIVSWTLQSL